MRIREIVPQAVMPPSDYQIVLSDAEAGKLAVELAHLIYGDTHYITALASEIHDRLASRHHGGVE